MLLNHSASHLSSFVDLTRVIVGPNARCAPEQFEHKKTPKSNDAPKIIIFLILHVGDIVLQSAHC